MKLTVVIPTRNRASALRHTLAVLGRADCADDVAIHVLDNSSEDDTEDVVRQADAFNVQYFPSKAVLSMSENFSRGVDSVDTEWMTILGDDDAIVHGGLRRILRHLRVARAYALRVQRHDYLWPAATTDGVGELRYRLPVCAAPVRQPIRVRAGRVLQDVLDGVRSYTDLPVIYNGGFVRSEAIQSLPRIDGCLFPDPIPDVYSGIALAIKFGDYLSLTDALIINGASAFSNGRATFGTQDTRRDAALQELFRRETKFRPSLTKDGRHGPTSIQFYVFSSLVTARRLGVGHGPVTSLTSQMRLIESRDMHRLGVFEWLEAAAGRQTLDLEHADSPNWRRFRYGLRKLRSIWSRVIRRFSRRAKVLRGTEYQLSNVAEAADLVAILFKEGTAEQYRIE